MRVQTHQCMEGLYRLRASLSVPSLFAARQRSATGGVGTLIKQKWIPGQARNDEGDVTPDLIRGPF